LREWHPDRIAPNPGAMCPNCALSLRRPFFFPQLLESRAPRLFFGCASSGLHHASIDVASDHIIVSVARAASRKFSDRMIA